VRGRISRRENLVFFGRRSRCIDHIGTAILFFHSVLEAADTVTQRFT
jgi:hypothetical protein